MPNPNRRPRVTKEAIEIEEEDIIQLLAKEVYEKTNNKIEQSTLYGIDPLTMILIIGIIVNVIRVIQECNKDKSRGLPKGEQATLLSTDIKYRAFNSGWFTKLRLKKIIKKHLNKEQSNKYADPLLATLLEVGKTVKEEQVSALLEYK